MSLESFSFIDSLNSANPTTTDNVSEGDDHIRGIKSTIKATFPNVTGAVNTTQAEANILDGATLSTAELNYVDGVTSAIQTQINTKLATAGGTMTGDLSLGDNVKAQFGAGNDLQMYHDASNNIINQQNNHSLRIAFAGSNQWEFNSSGIFKGNDGKKIILGDSSDLQIYHTNNNSWIEDIGTGDLILKTNGARVSMLAGSDTMFQANKDGAVNLYYDNGIKLATTSTGIDVTGTVTADGLTVGNAGSDYAIMIKEGSGGEYYQLGVDSYGGLVFYNETTKVAEFTDASTFITQGDITVNGTTVTDGITTSLGMDVDGSDDLRVRFLNGGTFKGGVQIATTAGDMIASSVIDDLAIRSQGDIRFSSGGNVERLKVIDTGIDVTGSVTADTEIEVTGSSAYLRLTSTSGTGECELRLGDSADTDAGSIAYQNNGDYMQFRTGAAERLRIDSSGNVGIGESNPTQKLDVKMATDKHIGFSGAQGEVGNVPALVAYTDSGSLASMGFRGVDLRFATGSTERLRIDSDGIVYINESARTANSNVGLLQVASSGASLWSSINTGTNAYSSMVSEISVMNTQDDATNSYAGIFFQAGETAAGSAINAARIGAIRESAFNTSLVFASRGDGGMLEKMRIDSSGNVGIGTSSIDVSTQAGGSGYRVLQIESADGGQLNFDHNDAGTGSTLGQINFQRAGEVLAEIEGVTSGATDSGHIGFRTQATGGTLTERMRIDSSGNVLVGTTARIDSSRFQIEGAKILSSGIPQNQLNISDSTALAIDVGGAIGFSGIYSGTSKTTYASIEGNKETADSGNYAGYIRFNTRTHGAGNDERMRIDSSGNVGIGVTPESWGGNFIATQIGDGASLIGRSTDEYAGFASNAYYDSVNDRWEYIGANGSEKATLYEKVNGTHAFYTAPSGSADAAITWTTAMTIDNVGRIIAGTNSSGAHPSWFGTGSSQTGMCIQGGGGGPHVLYLKNNDTSGGANMIQFVDGSGDLCGAINSNATSNTTSYTTSSDYRLKENVVPMTGSIDRLKELNPSRFNFISDPDTIFDGFLAHEAQEIVPECVTGTKDGMMTEEYEVSPAYGEVFTPAVEAIEEVTETVVISQAIEAVDAVTGERQVTITSESEKEVTHTEIVEVNGKWVQTSITETVTNEVSEPQWLDVPLYGEDGEQLQKLITESIEAIVGIEAVEALLDEDGNVVEAAVEAVEAVEAQDSVYEAVTHQIPVMETYEVSPAIEAAAEVTEVNIITEAVEAVAEVILESNVEKPENGTWRETTAQVMAEREVPDMQGIDQGKLVPLLVAALQEAIARIEVLEA